MTLAEWGPAGEDVPTLEMKWVEPTVLGSTLWAIIQDAPDAGAHRAPFDLDRFNAEGPLMALSEEHASGLIQIADGFVQRSPRCRTSGSQR